MSEASWGGDERDGFNVRSKILSAIDDTDDPKQRNLLLLLFGVLEVTERGLSRIEKKIDAVLKDEDAIKRVVLNGHVDNHHRHHDRVEHFLTNEKYYTDFITRTTQTVEWAEKKMRDEEDDKATKKGMLRSFFDGVAKQAGTALITLTMAYLMWGPK